MAGPRQSPSKTEMDARALKAHGAALGNMAGHVLPEVEFVVKRGALNIKVGMQAEMRSSKSFKGIAPAINYDVIERHGAVGAEIGPEKGPGSAGNLANIAYFGSSYGGGGTVNFMRPFEEEEPKFLAHIADAVVSATEAHLTGTTGTPRPFS